MAQLIMAEGANPPTPSTGKAVIHIDASGNLCKTDDGGNTMVLACAGDFTLTIPASGTVALLGVAQSITAIKTFDTQLVLGRTDLTIATGVITVTSSYHRVDTEASAATDDIDTINGCTIGAILVLQAVSSARTVVLKDATGNLQLAGDFSLDNFHDKIVLIGGQSTEWHELCRSDNGV